ncbi:1040_t:CDS:2 [Racocetra fulgida]|uniref:1040_t:CDS:1 n=1 Tax=Racocetra fulgida TaxID=60492 RepID=A0A9N9NVR6_9GLOM|nr:1040_t:CDS:2 [Racocetra fulgida]
MPPHNRGPSSRNPKCPECGNHYKDIDGHAKRVHKTTLSLLKQQAFQRKKVHSNRQAKRNERLYNMTQLIKTIEAYLRILHANEKDLEIFQLIYSDFNSLKRKSDEEIEREQLETAKNKIKKLEENEADSDSNLMRMEIDKKNEDIDNLTREVSTLKLDNKEKDNSIESLTIDIHELQLKLENENNKHKIFRATHENEIQRRDQSESDLHSQIRLLKNRIEDLELLLGISTRSYKTVTNERLYLEAIDSTADMDPISGPINTSDIIEIIDD